VILKVRSDQIARTFGLTALRQHPRGIEPTIGRHRAKTSHGEPAGHRDEQDQCGEHEALARDARRPSPERSAGGGGALEAARGVGFERPCDPGGEHVVPAGAAQSRELLAAWRAEGIEPSPDEQEIERRSERVEVRAPVDGLAPELLRRHERQGSDDARRGERRRDVGEARDAEVDEHGPAVGAHHDVRRLDVTVNDAGGVCRLERVDHTFGDRAHACRRERPAFGHLPQGLARHELHDEIPAGLVDVVNRDDVLVLQARRSASLAKEALPILGARVDCRVKDLHGDVTAEHGVVGAVHVRHGAVPDRRPQAIARWERGSRRRGGFGRRRVRAGGVVRGHRPQPSLLSPAIIARQSVSAAGAVSWARSERVAGTHEQPTAERHGQGAERVVACLFGTSQLADRCRYQKRRHEDVTDEHAREMPSR
jgi:hypothetical protein